MRPTVVCWLWNGWRNVYLPEHVAHLRRMIEAHTDKPFRFVCVTDAPERMPGIETIPLWDLPSPIRRQKGSPDCYKRLRLFSRAAQREFGDLVLSVDLDSVIMGDVLALIDSDLPFKILRGKSNPYNGSLWQVKPGCHDSIWDGLNQQIADRASSTPGLYGSDQAVMALTIPDAPTWGESDGVYQFATMPGYLPPKDARIVFFAGGVKPWDNGIYRSLYWRAGL